MCERVQKEKLAVDPRREPSGCWGRGFYGPFMTQENRAVGSLANPAWVQMPPVESWLRAATPVMSGRAWF